MPRARRADMTGVAARALYVGALMPATAYPTGSCTCTRGDSRVAEGPSASSCPRIHRRPPCCSRALPFANPADVRVVHEVRGAMVPDEQASRPAEDRHHLRAALRRLLGLRGATGSPLSLEPLRLGRWRTGCSESQNAATSVRCQEFEFNAEALPGHTASTAQTQG